MAKTALVVGASGIVGSATAALLRRGLGRAGSPDARSRRRA